MSGMIKKRVPEVPEAQPLDSSSPEVKTAAAAEMRRNKKRRGYASTIMTGAEGVTEEPVTTRATLGS